HGVVPRPGIGVTRGVDERPHGLARGETAERLRGGGTDSWRGVRDCGSEPRGRTGVVEERQMLDRRAADGFDRVVRAGNQSIDGAAVAEVSGDADGRLA